MCSRILLNSTKIQTEDVYEPIASDLSLSGLDLEFSGIYQLDVSNLFYEKSLMQILKSLLGSGDSSARLTAIFARIIAEKPHSADVKMLIRCNNVLM